MCPHVETLGRRCAKSPQRDTQLSPEGGSDPAVLERLTSRSIHNASVIQFGTGVTRERVTERERERESQRERERERVTERERETERQTDRDRETDRDR